MLITKYDRYILTHRIIVDEYNNHDRYVIICKIIMWII